MTTLILRIIGSSRGEEFSRVPEDFLLNA